MMCHFALISFVYLFVLFCFFFFKPSPNSLRQLTSDVRELISGDDELNKGFWQIYKCCWRVDISVGEVIGNRFDRL